MPTDPTSPPPEQSEEEIERLDPEALVEAAVFTHDRNYCPQVSILKSRPCWPCTRLARRLQRNWDEAVQLRSEVQRLERERDEWKQAARESTEEMVAVNERRAIEVAERDAARQERDAEKAEREKRGQKIEQMYAEVASFKERAESFGRENLAQRERIDAALGVTPKERQDETGEIGLPSAVTLLLKRWAALSAPPQPPEAKR